MAADRPEFEQVEDFELPMLTCPACGRTLSKLDRSAADATGYCSIHGQTVARKLANGLASMDALWVADLPKERP